MRSDHRRSIRSLADNPLQLLRCANNAPLDAAAGETSAFASVGIADRDARLRDRYAAGVSDKDRDVCHRGARGTTRSHWDRDRHTYTKALNTGEGLCSTADALCVFDTLIVERASYRS